MRHDVVSLIIYQISCQSDEGGVRLNPPPPFKCSCIYFFFKASRVNLQPFHYVKRQEQFKKTLSRIQRNESNELRSKFLKTHCVLKLVGTLLTF